MFKIVNIISRAVCGLLLPILINHGSGRTTRGGWHTTGGKSSGNKPHWHPRPCKPDYK